MENGFLSLLVTRNDNVLHSFIEDVARF